MVWGTEVSKLQALAATSAKCQSCCHMKNTINKCAQEGGRTRSCSDKGVPWSICSSLENQRSSVLILPGAVVLHHWLLLVDLFDSSLVIISLMALQHQQTTSTHNIETPSTLNIKNTIDTQSKKMHNNWNRHLSLFGLIPDCGHKSGSILKRFTGSKALYTSHDRIGYRVGPWAGFLFNDRKHHAHV